MIPGVALSQAEGNLVGAGADTSPILGIRLSGLGKEGEKQNGEGGRMTIARV